MWVSLLCQANLPTAPLPVRKSNMKNEKVHNDNYHRRRLAAVVDVVRVERVQMVNSAFYFK